MINQIISKINLSKFNITVILIIIFTTSLFNYNYIVSFETYSDSLVWGKIISKKSKVGVVKQRKKNSFLGKVKFYSWPSHTTLFLPLSEQTMVETLTLQAQEEKLSNLN